jgi:hypothetical protein
MLMGFKYREVLEVQVLMLDNIALKRDNILEGQATIKKRN